MTGLDTSVVLRLLVWEPVDQAERAKAFLDELFRKGKQAAISDLVASEVYFALQYHYSVPKADALKALKTLFDSGEFVATGEVVEVLRTKNLATANPGFVDRLIHRSYSGDGASMATFEIKAAKLESVRLL